ncbi:MAG: hypothetical protein HYT39_00575 [Candidatus Sungbacteria bacterium]|nr:hypothetical protein [Candidatus Sungbacteria bacterium]
MFPVGVEPIAEEPEQAGKEITAARAAVVPMAVGEEAGQAQLAKILVAMPAMAAMEFPAAFQALLFIMAAAEAGRGTYFVVLPARAVQEVVEQAALPEAQTAHP